jgi:hypothetical protein
VQKLSFPSVGKTAVILSLCWNIFHAIETTLLEVNFVERERS